MEMANLYYFLLSSLMICVCTQEACPYQECLCDGNEIICSSRNLQKIPQISTDSIPQLTSLDFGYNQITTVPAGSLPPDLTYLSFEFNPLDDIDDAALYDSVKTLQTLVISRARFNKLPQAIFTLKNLTTLVLSDISIKIWEDESMKKLSPTVVTLQLENLGLSQWPNCIQYFCHITDLTISGNSISSIPDNAFECVARTLINLQLNNNSLTSVPKALSNLTALLRLNLQNNRISNITWLPKLTNLSALLLNNNRLSKSDELSKALYVYRSTLNSLSINFNLLTSIPDLHFLTHVSGLDFSNNDISDINSGSVSPDLNYILLARNQLPSIPRIMLTLKITQLDLSTNRMTILRGMDFPNTSWWIDFGHNLITELTRSSFPENSSITFMYLSFNPISKISDDAFVNVPRLFQLSLQGSRLTRLPLGLASLNQLAMADFADSSYLVCTCLEKGLGPKILTMGVGNTEGDCGHTSIYNFFKTLIKDCPVST